MISRRQATVLVAIVISIVVISAVFVASRPPIAPASTGNNPPPVTPNPEPSACPRSVGLCIERNVTRIIDGDTLDVEGSLRIRLVLVNAPELNATGGPESRDYLTSLCSGASALVDEDDFQIGHDPYGRVLAVVYCGSTNANAAMISSGHATTYYAFCSVSEFGSAAWSGCVSHAPLPPGECDPSYPDVCIHRRPQTWIARTSPTETSG